MKRTMIRVFAIFVCLFALTSNSLATGFKITISLDHKGVKGKLYYLGDFKNDKLELSDDFKSLSNLDISRDKIIKDTEGQILSEFEALIEKNNLEPLSQGESDENKKLVFDEQERGLYLIRYEKLLAGSEIISYKSSYIYTTKNEVEIEAKHESHPQENFKKLHVVKIWRNDQAYMRPHRIFVDLYSRGERVDRIELSRFNSWRGSFEGIEPGRTYRVYEEVPEGYYSRVEYDYRTAYITNYFEDDKDDQPTDDDDQEIDLDDEDEDKDKDDKDKQNPDDTGDSDKDDKKNQANDNKEDNEDNKDNEGYGEQVDNRQDDRLPQTGLLWWPVGVFLGLGIFFIALYLVKRKKSEK